MFTLKLIYYFHLHRVHHHIYVKTDYYISIWYRFILAILALLQRQYTLAL